MNILIIDNFDSFTFNLYQYVGSLIDDAQDTVHVVRNSECSLEGIKALAPDRIIISPGPGDPRDDAYFGVCAEVLTYISKKVPTLGVCLGMQGCAAVYGADIAKLDEPVHGKTTEISHDGKGIFADLPQDLSVMRYHSLHVPADSIPDGLDISATSPDGCVMAIRHNEHPIEGVQFHPESFATEAGLQMLHTFIYGDY